MTESQTRPEIQVRQGTAGGPYAVVPVDQMPHFREILDRNGVHYWVSSVMISLDNKPLLGTIHFGLKGDKNTIQALFDAAD